MIKIQNRLFQIYEPNLSTSKLLSYGKLKSNFSAAPMDKHKNLFSLSLNKSLIEDNKYYLLLLIAFVVVCAIGTVNHEMWRDELEQWLIARDSNSISELLKNIEYIGHPALWYLCLYFFAKITSNPYAVQLFSLVIISSAVYIFLFYSPFNKLQKTLFCFGYFPLYEYGVISRSYSLSLFLVFLFCALFCRTRASYIGLTVILVMLSHTSVYGSIIGMVLAATLFLSAIVEKSEPINRFDKRNTSGRLTIAISIYLIGLCSAVWQIIPPANSQQLVRIPIKKDVANLPDPFINKLLGLIAGAEKMFTSIWRSYVPIPSLADDSIWGTNILTDSNLLPETATLNFNSLICVLLSLVLFAIFILIFSNNYKAAFVYTTGTVLVMLFGNTFHFPQIRHIGHLFIVLIISYWIYLARRRQDFPGLARFWLVRKVRSCQNIILTLILFLQLYGGIKMYIYDLEKPFSTSYDAAQFIINNNLENSLIIGSKDNLISPLSAWLDREIFYPEINDFGTFTVWTTEKRAKYRKRNKQFDDAKPNAKIAEKGIAQSKVAHEDVIKQMERLSRDRSEDLLLVLNRELDATSSVLDIELLASFDNGIVPLEDYYIYSVD